MSGPRAGSCADSALEKYLISTVPVPPTNTPKGQTPRLARVEPSSTNQSRGVDVRIEGSVRTDEGTSDAPTVQFRSMDLGKAPSVFSFNYSSKIDSILQGVLSSNSIDITDLLRVVSQSRRETVSINSFSKVPRFGIKRTSYRVSDSDTLNDSQWLGVTTHFDKFPTATEHNELDAGFSGVAGTWKVWGRPRLLETKDGKLQLWHMAQSGSSYDLVVSEFDPKTQTQFAHKMSLKASYGSLLNEVAQPVSGETYYPVGIAPVTLGDEIYCVVCVTRNGGDDAAVGYLYTFQLKSSQIEPVAWSSAEDAAPGPRAVPLVDLFIPGTDQTSTNPISPTKVFGGIDAVEMNGKVRVAIGVKCSGYCGSSDASLQRTIVYLDTPDFNSWGDSDFGGTDRIGPIPRILSLSDFSKTLNSPVNDFYRDALGGSFACGPDGSIFRTTNNGISWFQLRTGIEPENMKDGRRINLHAIHGYDGVIYAAGDYGTIIRSADDGGTWTVIRTKLQNVEFLYTQTTAGDDSDAPVTFNSGGGPVGSGGAIYGLWVKQTGSGNTLWACGQGGSVVYCADTGAAELTWVDVVEWNGGGSSLGGAINAGNYYSIVAYSGDDVMVVGDGNVHNTTTITSLTHRESRALRIESATTAKDYATLSIGTNFQLPVSSSNNESYGVGGNAVIRIRPYGSGGSMIAADASGHIYYASVGTFTYKHQVPSGTSSIIRDFVCDDGTSLNDLVANNLIVLEESPGGKSTLWYTLQALSVTDADSATRYRQVVIDGYGARSLSFKNLDVGIVGGVSGVSSRTTTLPQRARPAMVRLPSGAVMMVCINLNTGAVEHFEFPDDTSAARRIAVATNNTAIPDAMVDDNGAFDDTKEMSALSVPTPSLTIDETSEVLMCWGHSRSGYSDTTAVSLPAGNYSSWQKGTSPLVSLPLGQFPAITNYTELIINTYRDTKWFSRGRLFSTCARSDLTKIGVFVSRDFRSATTENPTNFPTIIAGKWQWAGINDMMVLFSGLPIAGDEYTASPVWSYSTTNLAIESPSLEWRSASVDGGSLVKQVELVWDRLDSDVTAILGDGNYWNVTACALFNKNFREFEFSVSSDAEFSDPVFVHSSQVIQQGTATNFSGGQITSVFKDEAASMVPSQYKLGASKQYYLYVADGAAFGNVYEIVDNGRDSIFIKNTAPLGSSFSYKIFSNRTFVDLTDTISDSRRYTARFLKLKIYEQKTVEGYFRIGTPIIGTYVTYTPYTGNESRRKYSEGFGWRPIPSAILQRADSGVSSVEHLGFQRAWTLPYDQMQWWDRDMQMNGLLPAMRQAFAIQFAPNDDNQLYLVRLNDGPQTNNTVQDRYSYSYQLEEVI